MTYISSPYGLVAINIKGTTDSTYYVCTDHQGSIMAVINSKYQTVDRLSYDAWGRRRNALTWDTATIVPKYTARGYTGHEHLDLFKLINMNGRLFDPLIARFLSPDPALQDAGNTQAYNKYSYCLNNPLKYTDPSGYLYDSNEPSFINIFDEAGIHSGVKGDFASGGGFACDPFGRNSGKYNSGIDPRVDWSWDTSNKGSSKSGSYSYIGNGRYVDQNGQYADFNSQVLPWLSATSNFVDRYRIAYSSITCGSYTKTESYLRKQPSQSGAWYSVYNWPGLGSSARTMDALYSGNYLSATGYFLTCVAEVFTGGYASGATNAVVNTVARTAGNVVEVAAMGVEESSLDYLPRVADATDLYHSFPVLFDKYIIENGAWSQRIIDRANWYEQEGIINEVEGAYQLGLNSAGKIFHKNFVPFK